MNPQLNRRQEGDREPYAFLPSRIVKCTVTLPTAHLALKLRRVWGPYAPLMMMHHLPANFELVEVLPFAVVVATVEHFAPAAVAARHFAPMLAQILRYVDQEEQHLLHGKMGTQLVGVPART